MVSHTITIDDPLEKVATHILEQSVAEDCGKFQLGNGISDWMDILI